MKYVVVYVRGEPARFEWLSDEESIGKGGIRRESKSIQKLRSQYEQSIQWFVCTFGVSRSHQVLTTRYLDIIYNLLHLNTISYHLWFGHLQSCITQDGSCVVLQS